MMSRPSLRSIARGMAFGCAIFTVALSCLLLAEPAGSLPPLWLANGLAIALLLLARPRPLGVWLSAAFAALAAAYGADGSALPTACLLAAINVVEIGGLLLAIERWRVRPTQPTGVLHFVCLALAFAALSAVAASLVLGATGTAAFRSMVPVRFGSDLAGLLMTVLPIVGVGRGEFASLFAPSRRIVTIACLLATCAVSVCIFTQHSYPLLFLVLPVLILSTYLLGNSGTALTNAAVVLIAIGATTAGDGPIADRIADPQIRIVLVQIFAATNLFVTFLVGCVIRQRLHLIRFLSEKEDRARRLTENAPAAIIRIGRDGTIDFANRRFCALVGRAQAELTGLMVTTLVIDPETGMSPEWLPQGWEDAGSVELTLVRPDATRRQVVLTATAEHDGDGDDLPVGWIMLFFDITQAREAQALLEEAEHSHRLLAEHSHDMIVRIGLDGVRRYVSPACNTVLGYTPAELVGLTPVAAIHVEDRARVAEVARSVLAGQRDPVATYRQQHRDGRYVWLEAVYRLVRDPVTGDPVELVASVRDISRRLDAEHAARESAARLHEANRLLTMAEHLASVGHWRIDTLQGTLFWSDEVYVIHGIPRTYRPVLSEAIGVYHPDDVGMVSGAVELCLEQGEPFQFEARVLRPNGEVRWVSASGQSERAPNGIIIGAVGVFQDLTERIAANRDLVEARLIAEEALQAQSIFTATMSHEIRTPLTGVLAAADLLQQAGSPEAQQRHLQALRHSTELLSSIINDVLVFAKLDQGDIAIAVEPFDPVALTRQVVAAFEGAAEAKQLVLLMNSGVVGASVIGDPTRIQRVLANLLANAVKFTATGQIVVTVGPSCGPAGPCWRFEVRDTGIGVETDKLDTIFDPFVQADASTTRSYGGTGLGLAICRLLVRAMSGEITATTTATGACFAFELPLPPIDAPSVVGTGQRRCAGATAAPAAKILLAEDNATNRYLIQTMLERHGHDVVAVEDGRAALHAVQWREGVPFDLVLMDIHMPEMDGVAAMRAIRRLDGAAASTAVCAITAEDSQQRRKQLLELGMDEVIAKPLKFADIETLLQTLLTGEQDPRPKTAAGSDRGPMQTSPIVDSERLESMTRALGRAGRDQLLDMLIADMQRLPQAIRERLSAGETVQAGLEAHSLKGAASTVGADALVQAIAAFESALAEAASTTDPLARLERAAAAVVIEGKRLRHDSNC